MRDVLHHPNGITLEGFEPPRQTHFSSDSRVFGQAVPAERLWICLLTLLSNLKELDKFSNLRLEVAGGMTAEDEPYVEEQERKLVQAGI